MAQYIEVVIPPLDRAYTYALPDENPGQIDIGHKVKVPLGKRWASGYVVARRKCLPPEAAYKVREIENCTANRQVFFPEQLEFFKWIADYYGSDLATVIDAAVPAPAPLKYNKRIVLKTDLSREQRSRVQRQIVDFLRSCGGESTQRDIARKFKNCSAALKKLEQAGVVETRREELTDQHLPAEAVASWAKSKVVLNAAQNAALEAIDASLNKREFRTFLLHGVAGSGKTEVYIEAIRHAAAGGMGSLVVVPEIALTPQLLERFRARLGDEIAVLHSALARRSRWDAWRALLENRNLIAIGTRSGIFAPLRDIGLLVVDEEQDASFKQQEGLRYNARDLAMVLGKLHSCPVVLGSATPALETFHNAAEGKYTCLSLPARPAMIAKVEVELVDLSRIKPWEMPARNVSPRLCEALAETLARNEQAFILYNRRGFASYLQCDTCENVLQCPNCSVTLTYHRENNSLLCHYCSLSSVPPERCPVCAHPADLPPDSDRGSSAGRGRKKEPGRLVQRGAGTEKIYDEIHALFPQARLDRLDRDSVSDHESYRRILDRVRDGTTQILVGTQMIAKGHDLPGVTLVGIADCDVGLHIPDFRAAEKVFHLLTQAAGRAGRSEKPGRVILQTRAVQHPSLIYTASQDFHGFARQELSQRRSMKYPPFSRILRVVASAPQRETGLEVLKELKRRAAHFLAERKSSGVDLLGPAPAPLSKLKTLWRHHLLIKSPRVSELNLMMKFLQAQVPGSKKFRVVFDMDPQDML